MFMRISQTIARLRDPHKQTASGHDRLSDLEGFGSNPGELGARFYLPKGVAGPVPVVVVLHGCTQTPASYDHGSGWSALADRHGFALLFPEQRRSNNPNLCFNWFQAEDTKRDRGEAASIQQMVSHMIMSGVADAERIFVTGLSAGGAMASVMLAAYPETFCAGAIIAGVAYGCAGSVGQAFECMSGRSRASAKVLGDKVRHASSYKGPWPRVSVWHGSADRTVSATNGDDLVKQWLSVHGLGSTPDRSGEVDGYPHRVWLGADGKTAVEHYVITGMGHGTPLAPGEEAGQSGAAGPHMLDAAISSTDHIARFFGLAGAAERRRAPATKKPPVRAKVKQPPPSGVQQVIEDALRKAGLMP